MEYNCIRCQSHLFPKNIFSWKVIYPCFKPAQDAVIKEYCSEYGNGKCRCADRVNYAIQNHRIRPAQLHFTSAVPKNTMLEVKQAMENIDDLSQEFAFCKTYQSPASLKEFIQKFLDGTSFSVITNA